MLGVCMALIDDEEDISAFEILYKECKSKTYIIAYKILKKTKVLRKNVFRRSSFPLRRISKKLTI